MTIDNRTELNNCSATTGWTGDDAVTVITEAGLFYEGSSSLSTQLDDADEEMHTTSIGGTRDLSDATCYMIIKDNLTADQAGGGVKFVLGDGTDSIGYEVGGNDVVGLPLTPFFNGYKLDVSNSAAFTAHAFSGSEGALSKTAITSVGFGTIHLSKASGAIDNVWMDRFSFMANGSPVLTINGGSSGTPESLADVAGDDITNGWGVVANPQGAVYNIFCPCEFGDDTTNADAYFSQSNAQIFLLGQGIGATHFNFSLLGDAGTGTQRFELINCVMVGLGARANWDFDVANHDEINLQDTQFVDLGTMTFPAQSIGNRDINGCTFTNCDQVYFNDIDADGCTFNGANDALGAVLWDENSDSSNQDNFTFNSDGSGHAIHINPVGDGPGGGGEYTFSLSGYTVTGYETTSGGSTGNTVFLVDNNNDNDVIINVVNGTGGFSYEKAAGYTGTVTVNNTVTLTITVADADGNAIEGARVRVEAASDQAEIAQGSTNSSGVFSDSNYNYAGDKDVLLKVRLKGYKNFRAGGTIISTGFNVGVTMQEDSIVDLP